MILQLFSITAALVENALQFCVIFITRSKNIGFAMKRKLSESGLWKGAKNPHMTMLPQVFA